MVIPAIRRGACPGLATPMQTGDGLLARIAPRSGTLSPAQLEAVGAAAQRFGNGVIEISTRGNLQIRGLDAKSHKGLMRAVDEAGIIVNQGVPVVAPALFAPANKARPDPSALKKRIGERLEQAAFAKGLAPKMSVILDAGGLVDLSGLICDVRAVHFTGESWDILVGGTRDKARRVGRVTGEDAVLKAVLSTLERIAARGPAARGHDLSPAERARIIPGGPDENDAPHAGEDQREKTPAPNLVGVHPLRGGGVLLAVSFPFGSVEAAQLVGLAKAARDKAAHDRGAERVYPLPGKILAFSLPDEERARELRERAGALGFVCEGDDPRLKVMICAGAPACGCAFFETGRVAKQVLARFGAELATYGGLHVSGCAKRCARFGAMELEIIGSDAGIEVTAPVRHGKGDADTDSLARRIAGYVQSMDRGQESGFHE